jgi:chromosome segregation and condensation protein ScpB
MFLAGSMRRSVTARAVAGSPSRGSAVSCYDSSWSAPRKHPTHRQFLRFRRRCRVGPESTRRSPTPALTSECCWASRPYELVDVAGGFQHQTRHAYAEVIRASGTVASMGVDLTALEKLVLTAVAYFQPVTRSSLGDILGRKISRDAIAALRSAGLVATGPRSPQPGAPHTYVTTPAFLGLSGLQSLRDLPDLDRLEEAGLLGKPPLPEELRGALGLRDDDEDPTIEADDSDEDGESDEEYVGVGLFEA